MVPIYKGQGFLISRLADRRRVRKNRERQKEKQSPFFKNSEEALSFLHDFKLENFKTMDKLVEALYMTKDTRSNYALETIPEYLLHSKAVQLTLSSTFDDMRCTLLRLLEKVKKLGLKNCLELIKYLNITSNNEDGSGNLLEEGIPEVIPKRDGPCFYLQDAKKTSKGVVYILEKKVIEFKRLNVIDGLLIVFGLYYILNLSYPDAFSQILGLMQMVLKKENFHKQYRSDNLQRIIDFT
ncbi:hypothetical protein Avbf_16134, partial [Armadillidium vulgare]